MCVARGCQLFSVSLPSGERPSWEHFHTTDPQANTHLSPWICSTLDILTLILLSWKHCFYTTSNSVSNWLLKREEKLTFHTMSLEKLDGFGLPMCHLGSLTQKNTFTAWAHGFSCGERLRKTKFTEKALCISRLTQALQVHWASHKARKRLEHGAHCSMALITVLDHSLNGYKTKGVV